MLCANCASSNPPAANFCNACGGRLTPAAYTDAVIGERRHLTVLFCDLVGSTGIAARLDPEQWHEVAAAYQRASAEEVTKVGGRVGKYLGDGLIAYFGYPEAMEDAAERAVRAGLAIVRTVGALSARYAPLYNIKLSVRVGVHAGSVVVAPGGGAEADMFGDAPNIAARVQAWAPADSVIVTEAVHDAVGGMFNVEDVGRRRLKGVEKAKRLFRVLGVGAPPRRGHGGARARSAFAGREEEMRLLLDRGRRAREGAGQVVLIAGEAGIGKSRVLEELRSAIAGEAHLWIECAGEALFDKTPFYAAVQMVTQGLGWRGDEPSEPRSAQLRRALEAAGLDVGEAFPLVAELLDLPLPAGLEARSHSAEEKRERLLAALSGWALNSARDQFLVVAVEDLHWVDPSTLELLALIAERAADARLLLIGTARPEFRAPWTMRSHHTQITLSRLDRAHVGQIVSDAMEEAGLAPALIDDVITRADGVPLFAEELARLMLESGGHAGPHDIPETLQDSLMARLDRLGDAKETAQIGAVLGREFGYEMLRALSPLSDDDLRLALAKLAEADLLYADGASPGATYRFKHSLVQDAAYDALLKRQRRSLHARVAQTIGEKFTTVADMHPEILAHHLAEAGEAQKAVEAWARSAKSAAGRYAYKESSDAFQRALATLATLPETAERDASELQLWRWLVGAAQIAYGYSAPETRQATKMARRLAEKTGDVRKQFAQIAGEWMAASSAGDHRASRRLAEQVLPLAHAQATPDSLATAHMIMLTSRFRLGDLVGAEEAYRAGETFFNAAEFVRRPGAAAQAFGNGAMTAWIMGNLGEARERIGAVHGLIRNSDNPYELAFSQYMAAMVALLLGDLDQADTLARKSINLSNQGRFPQFAATSSIVLGRVLSERGSADEGVPLLLQGLQGMARNRSRTLLTMYLTWLAASQTACGEADRAMETLEQALTINPHEKFFRPESLRMRAELRSRSGDGERASEDLRRAINLAKAMRADHLRRRAEASFAALTAAE